MFYPLVQENIMKKWLIVALFVIGAAVTGFAGLGGPQAHRHGHGEKEITESGVKCQFCNGTGFNNQFNCNMCNGSGRNSSY